MTDSTNDLLDRLWHSAGNSPKTHELEALRPRLLDRLRRDRRLLALRLAAAGAALALLSVVGLLSLSGDSSEGPGWATALLLAPPWVAFALFVRRLLRTGDRVAAAAGTIREALAAALAETRAGLARIRTVAVLHVVALPILALALRELVSAGKVSPSELRSLALVLGGILAATGAVLLHQAVARLSPRARRLAALLADYDGAGEGQAVR